MICLTPLSLQGSPHGHPLDGSRRSVLLLRLDALNLISFPSRDQRVRSGRRLLSDALALVKDSPPLFTLIAGRPHVPFPRKHE